MLFWLQILSTPRHFFIRCAVAGLLAIATNGSPLAETSQRRADIPSQHQLAEIVKWISENSDMPAIYESPHVSLVPPAQLAHMRYGVLLNGAGGKENGDHAAQTTNQREVIALYNNATKTIYLADNWSGANAKELSVLVHEMVHHLQNIGKVQYACPEAREKPAYLAQDKWLQRHGLSLEKEFDIDKFTLVMNSVCAN
jgi:hypothetical protein